MEEKTDITEVNELEMLVIMKCMDKYKKDDSPLGDLCKDMDRVQSFPWGTNKKEVFQYLDLEADFHPFIKDAVREFKALVNSRLNYYRKLLTDRKNKKIYLT
jgi:hypothetical protein